MSLLMIIAAMLLANSRSVDCKFIIKIILCMITMTMIIIMQLLFS